MTEPSRSVNIEKVKTSIEMIKTYVHDVDTNNVISVLDEILASPSDQELIFKLASSLKALGISQGAVMNYAPYVSVLVSINLFEEE